MCARTGPTWAPHAPHASQSAYDSPQGLSKMSHLTDLSHEERLVVYQDLFREFMQSEALASEGFRAAVARRDAAERKFDDAAKAAGCFPVYVGLSRPEAFRKIPEWEAERERADTAVLLVVSQMAESWFGSFEKVLSEMLEEDLVAILSEQEGGHSSAPNLNAAMKAHKVLPTLFRPVHWQATLDHVTSPCHDCGACRIIAVEYMTGAADHMRAVQV